MKTMSCDLCESAYSADSFDGWTQQMMGHYKEVHADFMKEKGKQSNAKEEGQKWMADMKAKFEALPEA